MKWATETPSGNAWFIVERSQDAIHFEQAGVVQGQDKQGTTRFSFLDENPYLGLSWYRLIRIEDGNEEASEMTAVMLAEKDGKAIYPNPAANTLFISGNEDAQITLVDVSGRTLLVTSAAAGLTELDITAVPAGLYVVRITGPSGTTTSRLLVNK